MWLPKDERLVLARYYKDIGEVGKEKCYDTYGLCSSFRNWRRKIWGDGQTDDKDLAKHLEKIPNAVRQYQDDLTRARRANKMLADRGLIQLTMHEFPRGEFGITLTVEGYDLGRHYSNWWDCSGLWFAAHQTHWIMLIISFLAGILGGMVPNLLSGSGKP